MKAFITRYALTKGIIEVEAREGSDGWFGPKGQEEWCWRFPLAAWHRTRKAAISRAEEMRVKKIASLKKQITKLENLKFT